MSNDRTETRIDSVCHRFEQELIAGGTPTIEEFLTSEDLADDNRSALFRELLLLEIDFRRKRGETPIVDDYRNRFAEYHDQLSEILEAGKSNDTIVTDSQTGDDQLTRTFVRQPTEQVIEFGDYELLEEIARGGMGVVFRARQRRLNRVVALKMVLAGKFSDDSGLQRFQAEAEAAARLDHANIVPIFEIGEHEGRPYFSMGLVEGESLARELMQGPFPSRRAATLMETIAAAVQYAHDEGIIHRDLKPANVLLDRQGRPRITDFGLAKSMEADSGLTASGQIMGTPSYMPPEQAAGLVDRIDVRSDVYSLGAILYALLTGRPPFQSAQVVETLRQVQDREPVRPRQLNPDVDRDLETICLKCLEKIPQRRYPTAEALKQDLARYLGGQPIQARPATRLERAVKWVRRRPAVAALSIVSGLAIVFLSMLVVGLHYQSQLSEESEEAGRQRDLANRARQDAELRKSEADAARDLLKQQNLTLEKQRNELRQQNEEIERQKQFVEQERNRVQRVLYAAAINLADRAWRENRVARMMRVLNQQIPSNDQKDLRGFEWYYLNRLQHGETRMAFRHLFGGARSVSISGKTGLAASSGKSVKVWSLADGAENLAITPQQLNDDFVNDVALSADGKTIAIGLGSGRFLVWDRMTNRQIFAVDAAQKLPGVISVAISPDGKSFLSVGARGEIHLWDEKGKLIREFKSPMGNSQDAEFSPDGRWLAVGCTKKAIVIWETATGKVAKVLGGFDNVASGVAWSHDGKLLAGADFGESVRVFEFETAKQIQHFRGHRGSVNHVAFHPKQPLLLSCGSDATARIWNVKTGREESLIKGHAVWLSRACWMPDGNSVITCGGDGSIRVWNPSVSNEAAILKGHTAAAKAVDFHPDGKAFATAGWDGKVFIRETATGRILRTLNCPSDMLFTLSFDATGQRLAAGGSGNVVYVWETKTGKLLHHLRGHTSYVSGVRFTADGRRLISSSHDQTLRVWDLTSGSLERSLRGHSNMVFAIAVHPTKPVIASGGHDYKLVFWDMKTWKQTAGAKIFNFPNGMTYSPDGKLLAFPTGPFGANSVGLHDPTTLHLLKTLSGHASSVGAIAFTPDGRRLITGSWDKTVKLWDVETGRETLTLPAHDEVQAVAVSPDGRTIVAACTNTTVMWSAPVPDSRPRQ